VKAVGERQAVKIVCAGKAIPMLFVIYGDIVEEHLNGAVN
jgi:hypothetical protein